MSSCVVKIVYQKYDRNLRKWFSHVVKGKKWACSTLKAGKNKPIFCIAKTLDFKRFSRISKADRSTKNHAKDEI